MRPGLNKIIFYITVFLHTFIPSELSITYYVILQVNVDKSLDFVDSSRVNTLPMFQFYFRGIRKRIFHSSSPPVFNYQLKDFLKNDLNKSTIPTHAGEKIYLLFVCSESEMIF